ncbi:TetR/AcrR family transcriptional regulator [Nocardia sp. CA2R105]|uniref:TetR/AcrR family transcriptional regulator n=1 Tax=Nocardia coffeae TaxID=2873381 RepID=UPI001CA70137|nr:TetR/AcrR family transcriptional regulator [Nocardia coffeae]MBY8862315.1 TetR/AcrR family transcriptional regulator [Nocardia coffeae]
MPAQLSDPRSRRSRSALEAALWELVAEHDLTQISISDITKRAGVNRSTFYEHYTDVHDLAASASAAMFDEMASTTAALGGRLSAEIRDVDNPLTRLFTHVADHAKRYRTLLGTAGSARVINHLLERIAIAAYVNRRLTGTDSVSHPGYPDEIPHDPEAALIAGAVLGTVIDWIRRDCPGTPEQMAAAVWPRLIGGLSAIDVTAAP